MCIRDRVISWESAAERIGELLESGQFASNVELADCLLYTSVGKDKKKQFDILKKLMNAPDVTEGVKACDAGREGELIFRSCLLYTSNAGGRYYEQPFGDV